MDKCVPLNVYIGSHEMFIVVFFLCDVWLICLLVILRHGTGCIIFSLDEPVLNFLF